LIEPATFSTNSNGGKMNIKSALAIVAALACLATVLAPFPLLLAVVSLSAPAEGAAQKALVLFEATDAAGLNSLWVTDGTAAGTHEVAGVSGAFASGIFGGGTAFYPDFTNFNGKVLFEGDNAAGQFGLWVTDGTGAYELAGISNADPSGLLGANSPDFTVFNGEVLFVGRNTAGLNSLWVTNGTAAGTHELTGISGTSAERDFTVFNNEVLFNGINAAYQSGLWVSNGTADGTQEVTGITGADVGGLFYNVGNPDLTVFNGETLFVGTNAAGDWGLWVTNGTAAGTHELTGISGAFTSGIFAQPPERGGGLEASNPDFTVFNGKVLFCGFNSSEKYGLWVTNGTAAGTHELTGISGAFTGQFGLNPSSFTVFKNNEVMFVGRNAASLNSLWVTNGTASGTHELTGIAGTYSGSGGFSPDYLVAIGNKVLFRGVNANGQLGLWITDGTAAGTHELTGISGGAIGGYGLNPHYLTAVTIN
jgi:ELWxxDGT repeat protein